MRLRGLRKLRGAKGAKEVQEAHEPYELYEAYENLPIPKQNAKICKNCFMCAESNFILVL